jgi:hypothetical protein
MSRQDPTHQYREDQPATGVPMQPSSHQRTELTAAATARTRQRVIVYVFAGLVATSTAVIGAQRTLGPLVSFEPGLFKMLNLGSGGSVPAEGPIVKVAFDRTHGRYSHIDQQPLALRATVQVGCGSMNLEEMHIATLGTTFSASTTGLAKAHGTLSGTKTFTTNQLTTASLTPTVPDPVATCNSDMNALVKQGKQSQIQKGWARRYENVLLAELTASCKGEATKRGGFWQPGPIARPSSSARFPVWIHCAPGHVAAPAPKPAPAEARPAPRTIGTGLQSARVFVNPPANASYRGPCPRVIAFGGELDYVHAQGGAPLDLRYRYRTHDGGESPIMTTSLTQTGKRNISYWKREFGRNGQTGPGGLAAPSAGTATRVIDGWVRLEVLGATGSVVTYDQMKFRLTCEASRAPGALRQR